jgi:hypothetical protein
MRRRDIFGGKVLWNNTIGYKLYLTEDEKRCRLDDWESQSGEDPGVRSWCDKLNKLDGVCTVQSCIGHVRRNDCDVVSVDSGHIEFRLDQHRTMQFYSALPIIRGVLGCENVIICWRPGYQICSVWFYPGLFERFSRILLDVFSN